MKVVLFCHSLLSDWNHGNAHFLRGVVAELRSRGHSVAVYEPEDGWSRVNLVSRHGPDALDAVRRALPWLESETYDAASVEVGGLVEGADLVLVHEWNDPSLVAEVGRLRRDGGYRALFHDTHHRFAGSAGEMARYDLSGYDGVLAFGAVIRDLYIERSWADRAWTWHEAADVRVHRPVALDPSAPRRDLVWIGNWGDDERAAELYEFLIGPSSRLGLTADAYGVRYPEDALRSLGLAGIEFLGWLPNHQVPSAFARHRVTVHVPRRPYAQAFPGIPTIRVFEALACGIPLVSAPWDDAEHLFRPGTDFLIARDGQEMERHLSEVVHDVALAESLRSNGLTTILSRHTCSHRVDELLAICEEIGIDTNKSRSAAGRPA